MGTREDLTWIGKADQGEHGRTNYGHKKVTNPMKGAKGIKKAWAVEGENNLEHDVRRCVSSALSRSVVIPKALTLRGRRRRRKRMW